jgi:hypothetical protein
MKGALDIVTWMETGLCHLDRRPWRPVKPPAESASLHLQSYPKLVHGTRALPFGVFFCLKAHEAVGLVVYMQTPGVCPLLDAYP